MILFAFYFFVLIISLKIKEEESNLILPEISDFDNLIKNQIKAQETNLPQAEKENKNIKMNNETIKYNRNCRNNGL